jgi:hypothetical protein
LRGAAVAALNAGVGLRRASVTVGEGAVLTAARPMDLPTVVADAPLRTVRGATVHVVLVVVPAAEPPARAMARALACLVAAL